ncbi:HNH endonuclease [Geodermatophilus siccatus]|uniref:HNH endonuclease n=1 Tax=Geodermatophilus siccatus TaxID=1137991 RepID=A0A1G9V154_9ACTN|nr:HNH endonuclease [Geodermatophilus siccatus]SDM65767.1 HNH endonuclease [Geodermatophilus siccatus]
MTMTTEQERAQDWQCLHCGTPLPENPGTGRLYCDRACARAYRRGQRNQARPVASCQRCGQAMPGKRPQAKWCSDLCRNRANQERNRDRRNAAARERARAKSAREYDASSELWAACWRCGDLFLLRNRNTHCQRPDCQRAAKSLATRLHGAAQRVRKAGFGAAIDKFTVRDVYERDNGNCYLCGRPTIGDLDDGRQPASATLEHVVPIEQGGAHTLGNVRLAHLECNVVKGSRSTEEAREALAGREPVAAPEQQPATVVPLVPLAYALANRLRDVPRDRPGGRPLITALPAEPADPDPHE